METKRQLVFDYASSDSFSEADEKALSKRIGVLKENKVKTVFIITSDEIVLEPYMKLLKIYEENGFSVTSINIEALDKEHLPFVKNAVEDINASFRKGSCLIISFGRSVAGALIACFYAYSGRSLSDSLEKVKSINSSLIQSKEEISFIREFRRYTGMADEKQDSDFDIDKYISQSSRSSEDESGADTVQQEIKKERRTDRHIQEEKSSGILNTEKLKDIKKEKAEPAAARLIEDDGRYKHVELKGVTKFYSSIKFKLISISSLMIVISLLGMTLLATYFFKKDNEIRVQENNLNVSQVTALKIKSDFQAFIDKSKIFASALTQNISKKELENYSKLIFGNDRDFLFFGMAVKAKGTDQFNFVNNAYNASLMVENQITPGDIEAANKIYSQVFNESFGGEIVVNNTSQAFRIPVIGLSLPFQRSGAGGYSSVLICYIKLDRFLEAFQTAGITKTYMVNGNGDILAHADSRIVLGGGSYAGIPIVKLMMKSTALNGYQKYLDENNISNLGFFTKIGIGGCGVIATVEENVAYKEVYNQRRRNIYLAIIVLTIVVLLIYFFGKSLTTPIIRLLGATKKIKNGDYNVSIRPSSHDEIGELTSAFIEMGNGLEEREKIKTAFGKFVNPELAEMVMKDGISLGGERKTVAIMFSDIRNFTAMSETLQPEEVVEFLNAYMTKMVECIDRTGGVVDKFIGDAIMAEWGIPVSRGNDTENAINGTLLMRKVLTEFNKSRSEKGKPPIKIGCGINTGPVLAGQIGSEDRMEYTVIGDAVNLASRIEALNKPFGTDIIISEDSYNLVKNIFIVEKMAPIKVKGKQEQQQIYAILDRRDNPNGLKTIQELRDLLGTVEMPFRRRKEDLDKNFNNDVKPSLDTAELEEEVKYEILS
jgi:adenylate cyclase